MSNKNHTAPKWSDPETRRRYMAEWRAANKEKRAAYIKEWREKNKDHVTAYRQTYEPSPEAKQRAKERWKRYYEEVFKSSPSQLERAHRYSKAYDADHPEKLKARTDRYKQKNRELLAAKANAAYHAKSPDQRKAERAARKEYLAQWMAANKERIAAERRAKYDKKEQNRRYKKNYAVKRVEYIQRANARQRLLVGRGEFTQQDVDRLFEKQNGKCTGCRVSLADGYEIDHVMPISLGGSNTADNLQLLCMPCNRRKHDMHPDEWAARIGKLFV